MTRAGRSVWEPGDTTGALSLAALRATTPVPSTLEEALVQLAAAQDILRAIGAGEVDAFVVSEEGENLGVLSLSTADRPYRRFVEHMRDGAATISSDGLVLFANDRLAELLRCPRESLYGVDLATLVVGELPAMWREHDLGSTTELALVDREGVHVPVLVGSSPLEIEGEQLLCLTFTDLTAQKAQELEIARLHRGQVADGLRFTAVVEGLQEGVLVQDGEGRVLEANRAASDILGVPLDRLVTDPPSPLRWKAAHDDGTSVAPDQTQGRRALAEGTPVLGVMVRVERHGERVWLEINSVPLRLPGDSEVPVVISSFRDVTARVAADEAIRFQALLLDTAGQAIVAVDDRGIVLYWNNHAEQLYGWAAEEAVGLPVSDLILPAETVEQGQEMVADMQAGDIWSSDHWVKRRDGTMFPVFATSTPVFGEDGELVAMISVATDITDRKRAEDRSRRLSAIVESSSDAIIGLSLDRVITTWNPGATAVFGYEPDEIIGHNISDLAASAERYEYLMRLGAAQGMSLSNVKTQCRTKYGAMIQVSLSVSPIVDERGHAVGLSTIARDITERVELERLAEERSQELLVAQHAAELEAMEREEANRANQAKSEFLSRMSHELRTPLNAVLGFGQILLMDDLTDTQRENVDFIRSAGEHLLDLINDVLDISRIEAGALRLSLEPVRLDEVVAHALSLIRPQAAQAGISLPSAMVGATQASVHSDRQRLLQVLLNLLSNAVKYNRPGGTVEILCESSGGTVSLSVTDTGLGISDTDLGKLFTPFERLGAANTTIEGTGVGLALSRVLSQQMGGSLTVSSSIGTGSTFTLELPASRRADPIAPEADDDAPAEVAADPRLVTVLAIEDNVANIRLLERAMQRCGHVQLLTAIQGRLGIEIAVQHQPDLILLDLHLPDLPGEAVLAQLGADAATQAIPVVICSGDASPKQRRRSLEAGAAEFLTKPLDLLELFALVERARAGWASTAT